MKSPTWKMKKKKYLKSWKIRDRFNASSGEKIVLMGYIVFIYDNVFFNLEIGRNIFLLKVFELSIYEKINLFLSMNI
jgi:hypothetical protein